MKRCMVAVLVIVVSVALTGFGWAQEPAATPEAAPEMAPAAAPEMAPAAAPEMAPAEAMPAAEEAMQQVESTLIKEVAYDEATQVLTLVMGDKNEKYAYKSVPKDIYDGLMAAESKGKYFLENIKGKFEFEKLP